MTPSTQSFEPAGLPQQGSVLTDVDEDDRAFTEDLSEFGGTEIESSVGDVRSEAVSTSGMSYQMTSETVSLQDIARPSRASTGGKSIEALGTQLKNDSNVSAKRKRSRKYSDVPSANPKKVKTSGKSVGEIPLPTAEVVSAVILYSLVFIHLGT